VIWADKAIMIDSVRCTTVTAKESEENTIAKLFALLLRRVTLETAYCRKQGLR